MLWPKKIHTRNLITKKKILHFLMVRSQALIVFLDFYGSLMLAQQ